MDPVKDGVFIPALAGKFNFRGGSGAAKIAGLTQFMAAMNGAGNKNLQRPCDSQCEERRVHGRQHHARWPRQRHVRNQRGNDLIDGDLWLNVQLRAVMNDGTIKLVDYAAAI